MEYQRSADVWEAVARAPITSSIEITGLKAEERHRFRLRRKRLQGKLFETTPFATAEVETMPIAPLAIADVAAAAVAGGLVRLQWRQPSKDSCARVLGYQVQQALCADSAPDERRPREWIDSQLVGDADTAAATATSSEGPASASGAAVTRHVVSVVPSERYVFRVRPLSAFMPGEWAEFGEVRLPAVEPQLPLRVTASAAALQPSTSISVSWEQHVLAGECAVMAYDIQIRLAPAGEWRAVETETSALACGLGTHSRKLLLGNLRPGQQYGVRVRSTSKAGAGSWVEGAELVRTAVVHPELPEEVSASAADPTHACVALSWAQPLSPQRCIVLGYEVEQCALPSTVVVDDLPDELLGSLEWAAAAVESEATELGRLSLERLGEVELDRPKEVIVRRIVTGLRPGTAYVFRLRVLSAAGASKWARRSNRIETGLVVPCAPMGLETMPCLPAHNAVLLAWEQCGRHSTCLRAAYEVQALATGSEEWEAVDVDSLVQHVVPSSGHSGLIRRQVRVTNLTSGIAYHFRIRALNADGDGTEFEEAPVPHETVLLHPPVPVALAAAPSTTSVVLSWEQPVVPGLPEPDGYLLQQAFDPLGHWVDAECEHVPTDRVEAAAATEGHLAVKYRCYGLRPGRAYRFRVRTIKRGKLGEADLEAGPFVMVPVHPSAPVHIELAPGFPPSTSAVVWWEQQLRADQCCVDGYELQLCRAPSKQWISWDGVSGIPDLRFVEVSGSAPTSVTVKALVCGLVPSATYTFRVRPRSQAGAGGWSETSAELQTDMVEP